MPDSTTMGIERKVKDVAPRLGHEINEFRTPTEDSVYADLLHEARELSNSTFVVPLRIAKDRLGNVVNDIRDGIFAHGVVVPVSGPETGHFEPQAGPGQVFANPNMVVDGSFGDGVDMTISRMHKVEAAAVKFVPLAKDEYRLEALRGFLEATGQPSVYDRQSERHLTLGQIEGLLADVMSSYQTKYDAFWEEITGKKVIRPKKAEGGRRIGGLMAPPVRIVDDVSTHVAQVSPDVEAWYRNTHLRNAALLATGSLAALAAACAGATPVVPTPIAFVTPTESSPTATTPPTVEAPTATTAPTEAPTDVPTPEPTATEVPAGDVASQNKDKMGGYYREGVTYSYTEENGVKYMADEYGNKMLKYDNGAWVETSKEEKWGHMLWSEKDTNYQVEMKTGSNNIKQFTVNAAVWTGYHYRESIPFEEGGVDVGSTVIVLVTRDVNGKIVEILDVSPDYLGPGVILQPIDGLTVYSGVSHNLQDLLDIFAKYNITLAGRPVNMTIFDTMVGSSGRGIGLKFYPTCSVNDTSWNGRLACSVHLGLEMGKAGKISFQDLFDTLNGNGDGEDSFTVYEVNAHINIMGEVGADQKAALQKDLDDLNAKFK